MNITIKPLSPDLVQDFISFFESIVFTENPNWSMCYCYSFHFTGPVEQWNKKANRAAAIKCIQEKTMTGYLAYSNGKPVGWCNANNRYNYQRLMKYYDLVDNPDDKVCSVVCFLIHPDFRRQGIAYKLLERITTDYTLRKYDYLEAYPGKGEQSCEQHYKGPLSMYKKLDFKIVSETDTYFVVRKMLRRL